MKLLDLLTLILLLIGGVSGFRRGLIVEAFSIGALFIAACISAALLDTLLAWCNVPGQQDWESWLPYVAFGGVFVVLVVLITLLGRCIKRLVKPTLLGSLDRLLGCLIGMLKWGTFASAVIWCCAVLQVAIPAKYTDGTVLFPIVQALAPRLLSLCAAWWPWLQTHYDATAQEPAL